ncbi:hypothetical protein BZA05DRAFT_400323 [Tricharina praecox]|uniref:uncharacterized protein n=1 Tax=Tricharina praecox TaxID=43433 RepID=UPI00222015EA|nr:uncharacterized protein BZA05DRAFT_400323 [Tricharina praecox]KAI5849935.1 hypothetical protein BZA05DRAFT_400323 [Tricharina praecox]
MMSTGWTCLELLTIGALVSVTAGLTTSHLVGHPQKFAGHPQSRRATPLQQALVQGSTQVLTMGAFVDWEYTGLTCWSTTGCTTS